MCDSVAHFRSVQFTSVPEPSVGTLLMLLTGMHVIEPTKAGNERTISGRLTFVRVR